MSTDQSHTRRDVSKLDGLYRLGQVLLKMGQPERAQQVYTILLEQESEESAKAPIYHQLGAIKDELKEYSEAIAFYEKDLEISKKTLSPNHPDLAISYNNLGNVYACMGNYSKALTCYEETLAIKQRSLPPNHPDLAMSYNNIGNVYAQTGDDRKALSSHEKAHTILQKSLPTNHPDLATSHYNIGLLYERMGDYSKAYSSYKQAVDIAQRSLPPNHPDLQDYRKELAGREKEIAVVYSKKRKNKMIERLKRSLGHA